MKSRKLGELTFLYVFLLLSVMLLGTGCKDDENEYSGYVEVYIVGSFIAGEVNENGQGTGSKTQRGYCIVLEGFEDESTSFYTFNFPDSLFSFPDEILSPDYNGNNCGPTFFPEDLKNSYKIEFKYKIVDEPDKVQFVTGCFAMLAAFPWNNYNQIIVSEVYKK